MSRNILFAVTALFGAALAAEAANLASDLWTNTGHAWNRDNQPHYNRTEQIIMADDRSDPARFGMLKSSVGPGWLIDHLTGHSFYAGLTPVDFTLKPKDVMTGTQVIRLEVLLSFGFHGKPTLTVNRWSDEDGELIEGTPLERDPISVTPTDTYLPDLNSTPALGTPPSDVVNKPLEMYLFSWTLDHPLGDMDTFELNFGISSYASISSVMLMQEAIPEPSTYALLAGAFGLAAVLVARRRRRA